MTLAYILLISIISLLISAASSSLFTNAINVTSDIIVFLLPLNTRYSSVTSIQIQTMKANCTTIKISKRERDREKFMSISL